MSNDILTEQHGDVRLITINRPAKMNSLDFAANDALVETFREFAADDCARVAVVTGAGDKEFLRRRRSEDLYHGLCQPQRTRVPNGRHRWPGLWRDHAQSRHRQADRRSHQRIRHFRRFRASLSHVTSGFVHRMPNSHCRM